MSVFIHICYTAVYQLIIAVFLHTFLVYYQRNIKMVKFFLLVSAFLFGMPPMQKTSVLQGTILIKQQCKIINHGYYFFCVFNTDNETITEYRFSYSLNMEEKTYVVGLNGIDTIKIESLPKNYFDGFCNSENYKGSKSFLIFHPSFLKWNNMQKLHFFIQQSNNKKR